MRIVEPGHVYACHNLCDNGEQTLTFVKRSSKAIYYGHLEHKGTNTQEVLRALIDRCWFLNSVIPCQETQDAVYHLRMALFLFEVRAVRRKVSKLNRAAGAHVDDVDLTAHRDGYKDIPFSEFNIEHRPTDHKDGHLLLSAEEKTELGL